MDRYERATARSQPHFNSDVIEFALSLTCALDAGAAAGICSGCRGQLFRQTSRDRPFCRAAHQAVPFSSRVPSASISAQVKAFA
jgi:hypothetical protein